MLGGKGLVASSMLSGVAVAFALIAERVLRRRRFSVAFLTSGSTSKPKEIVKTFESLAKEIAFHRKRLEIPSGTVFLATIEPQHMYGTLWRELLPSATGCQVDPDVILAPEQLIEKMKSANKVFFVTTPTFLKRFCAYTDQYDVPQNCIEIVTSGALLDADTSAAAKRVFGIAPQEIFGSTETGGVAWRRQDGSEAASLWTVFDPVKVKTSNEGRLVVTSPFSFKRSFEMGDGVELSSDGRRFRLLGRMDRVVKIAEQRVSLPEMEKRIKALDVVDDVALTVLEMDKGTCIGAVLVLSDQRFVSHDPKSILEMRRMFSPIFPRGALPKRYRFVTELPRNPQGKVLVSDLKALFEKNCSGANS
jgi:acyl-coenzyme A synthetase/AMP-(fatty) acid ligase